MTVTKKFEPGFRLVDGSDLNTLVDQVNASIAEGDFIPQSEKGQPDGVASLDGAGKISASELPPLDHEVGRAANQAAMLALPVEAPAVAIRTDFSPPHVFYLTADPASTLANWVDTGEFGAGGADPTATVGLAAKNGVATSFMRSDGAPGIDQAIVPTWTGTHTFNGSTGSATASIVLGNNNPELRFFPSNGDVDTRMWRVAVLAVAGQSSFNIFGSKDSPAGNLGYAFQANHNGTNVTYSKLLSGAQSITVYGSQAPGITSNSGTGAWQHTGAHYVAGEFSAAQNAGVASPTNSGIALATAPNWSMAQFYDSARAANDRSMDILFIGDGLHMRFVNDARNAFLDFLSVQGGQASGITGIASDSGSGAWTHTGSMLLTGSSGGLGPELRHTKPDAPANQRIWRWLQTDTNFGLYAADDALGNSSVIGFSRSGTTVTNIVAFNGYVPSTPNSLATKGYVDEKLPAIVASTALINQAADATDNTLYAVPADGTYRVTAYLVLTRAATTSATLPGCNISYTDLITNVAMTSLAAQSAAANVVGTHLNGSVVLEAKSGTNIGFATTGYASSGATTMQYRVRVVVERLQ